MQFHTLRPGQVAGQPLSRTKVVPCSCSALPSVPTSPSSAQAAPSLIQAKLLTTVSNAWYSHQRKQLSLPAPSSPQELRQQMATAGRSCMAVLPFAAATVATGAGGGMGLAELFDALAKAIDIYLLILTVRVLLSWFRNISWYNEPFRTLRLFTDPALNACRGIIPAIGGMDLSPMLLFFGLNFAAKQLKILAFQYAVGA